MHCCNLPQPLQRAGKAAEVKAWSHNIVKQDHVQLASSEGLLLASNPLCGTSVAGKDYQGDPNSTVAQMALMCVDVYICAHMYMYVYICNMYINIYACMYIHVHMHIW